MSFEGIAKLYEQLFRGLHSRDIGEREIQMDKLRVVWRDRGGYWFGEGASTVPR